jgi:hypothetical protein
MVVAYVRFFIYFLTIFRIDVCRTNCPYRLVFAYLKLIVNHPQTGEVAIPGGSELVFDVDLLEFKSRAEVDAMQRQIQEMQKQGGAPGGGQASGAPQGLPPEIQAQIDAQMQAQRTQ